MKVIVVGGGASGILAAIALKQKAKQVKVTIVERLDKIGKKILATGNGKCNFTNRYVSKEKYNNKEFADVVINKIDTERLVSYFLNLGLVSKELTEGRIYPYSESAQTVLEILKQELIRQQIDVITNFEVEKITNNCGKFQIYNHNEKGTFQEADYIILACGGRSQEILGSNGSGYGLLNPWKIKCTKTLPGLVGFIANPKVLKPLAGIRYKAIVKLISVKKETVAFSEYGEVQFKSDGLSGIVIMQASSFAARNKEDYYLSLDLMPNYTEDELTNYLKKNGELFKDNEITYLTLGFLPKMLSISVLKQVGLNPNTSVNTMTSSRYSTLSKAIKNFKIEIDDFYDFSKSQVTIGGIDVNELNQDTLELKKLPNAFLCGEMLDIDGECGGYNLHFAFASGIIAGKAVANKVLGEKNA